MSGKFFLVQTADSILSVPKQKMLSRKGLPFLVSAAAFCKKILCFFSMQFLSIFWLIFNNENLLVEGILLYSFLVEMLCVCMCASLSYKSYLFFLIRAHCLDLDLHTNENSPFYSWWFLVVLKYDNWFLLDYINFHDCFFWKSNWQFWG